MEVKDKGKEPKTESIKENTEEKSEKLGGNITLSGFNLEPIEMVVVKKIIGHYAKKISEKISYKELKITLKQSRKTNMFLHQIKAEVLAGKLLEASSENKNLYNALSDALNKVYAQAEHKERTPRQLK